MNSDNISIYGVLPERPSRCGLRYRLIWGLVGLICLGVLTAACFVKPEPAGVGTHEQLDLPACGFLERTGYPCVTCGMTTAFSYMVRGRVIMAFIVQPAGALGAVLCAVVAGAAMYVTVSGRRVNKYVDYLVFNPVKVLMVLTVVVLVAWLLVCLRVKVSGYL